MTAPIERDHGLHLLQEMLRIRRFEERCVELYSASKIRGFLHLYIGEEAVAVGAMQALDADDAVVATYREHGHALARGVPARAMMAEMFGKAAGAAAGAAGRCTSSTPHAASTAATPSSPAACRWPSGSRWPTRWPAARASMACFFGEGAMAEGEFHESMNLAALWRLPVLFCCENNLYAMGTALERSESADRPGPEGRRLRDAGLVGRRHGRPRRSRTPSRRAARRCAVARAVLPGAADLPLPRPLDVRPRPVPQQGRDRALAQARPARAVRGRAARGRAARRRRARAHRGGGRRRDRRCRRVCRGGRARAGRGPRRASCTPSRRRRHDRHDDHHDDLPRGAARGAARCAAPRRARVPDGRGRRPLRRVLRRQPRPARRVRPRAHPRHAAVGVGLRRRRHRRRARRHAADRRDHDRQLQPARARPDRQQRGDDAAHVGRPVPRAAGHPHDDGGRPPARRAALPQPRVLVRPRAGPARSLAPATLEDARGMLWPALRTPTR